MRILMVLFFIFASSIATAAPETWNPAAKTVCDQIDRAVQFYKKGDIKNSRLNALMSYFKGYDAEIEPAVRITLGGQHVFEIEHQFRDFAKAMTPHPDKKQQQAVANLATQLCSAVNEDAKALNAANIPRQVFQVQ